MTADWSVALICFGSRRDGGGHERRKGAPSPNTPSLDGHSNRTSPAFLYSRVPMAHYPSQGILKGGQMVEETEQPERRMQRVITNQQPS